jgi:hypothetical protein
MRRVAMAFGFKMARTAHEKTELNAVEKDLMNGAPVKGLPPIVTKSWSSMPQSVQSSLQELLAQHTKRAVEDVGSN